MCRRNCAIQWYQIKRKLHLLALIMNHANEFEIIVFVCVKNRNCLKQKYVKLNFTPVQLMRRIGFHSQHIINAITVCNVF
jgi:hypothetical protein